jgi:hypothetical protein
VQTAGTAAVTSSPETTFRKALSKSGLALGEALRQVVPVRAFASHHPLKFGMMLAQPDTLRGMQRRAGDLGREPRLEAVLRNHSPSIK